MRASHCVGSCCGAPALDAQAVAVAATGSVVVAPMPLRTGSAVAHGLAASACGFFQDQGWNPCPLY